MKLSILICSLGSRHAMLARLLNRLNPQLNENVEVLVETDYGTMSIGEKRNRLLDKATGDYIAFIDDDDLVATDYVSRILDAVKTEPDCVGIEGRMTTDGADPRTFIHSFRYKTWYEQNGIYYRNPNHLNPVKREIALKVRFPDKNHGEDRDYSMSLLPLLTTEVYLEGTTYEYLYITKRKHQPPKRKWKRKSTTQR
ncbi:MAG: glycosyltransferase family 2 protein [Candidatus Competibacteraceae bacterium]|nr:glycosyltransferase family 2 protein [Candidatus Competibacteraceae bacterium]